MDIRATPISRRGLVGSAIALGLQRVSGVKGRGALYAHSDVIRNLQPPLTLGMARVVLRSGAITQSTTQGVRMISVESGVVAVGLPRRDRLPISPADLSRSPRSQHDLAELIMATGASLTADDPGVMSLRNPGAGAAVVLDVVVYRAAPRPYSRAFTNDDISFQLLAGALADAAPDDRATVRLERQWLSPGKRVSQHAGAGMMVAYLERGTVQVTRRSGDVATARAAAAAPYSQPGALQGLTAGTERLLTAGGTLFVPVDGEAIVQNSERRDAEFLVLSVLAA